MNEDRAMRNEVAITGEIERCFGYRPQTYDVGDQPVRRERDIGDRGNRRWVTEWILWADLEGISSGFCSLFAWQGWVTWEIGSQ